jgi:pyrimidine operon attenuation protein/uracil phosphoribosyltransferase
MNTKTLILNSKQTKQKINRIVYQIIEHYYDETEIIFVGISKRGYLLAKEINKVFISYSDIKATLIEAYVNKENPSFEEIKFIPEIDMENKIVILIDDVLNSGSTLMFVAGKLITKKILKMNTVVLVDRRHRKFPIKADWAGLTLSTTLQEHISVDFTDNKIAVSLE